MGGAGLDLATRLGPATSVALPMLGFGGGALNAPNRRFDMGIARATIAEAWRAGMRYFDTAPLYGYGVSENLIGEALHAHDEPAIVSTKVGRRLVKGAPPMAGEPPIDGVPFGLIYDYSRDGAMRSIEASLCRLNRTKIDIALIHDIDHTTHAADQPRRFREAMDGAFRGLRDMKDAGLVGAIGLGVSDADVCAQALQHADFDCFLVAGRYTLLNQSMLDSLIPLCRQRRIGLVIGGPYNSGILANPSSEATFDYGAVPDLIRDKVRSMMHVCEAFNVSLPAAALRFPLAEPAVRSVIPGARTAEEVKRNVQLLQAAIPRDFWDALKAEKLIRADAATPATDRI